MSTEIDNVKEELEKAQADHDEYLETTPVPEYPSVFKYKCPKCKVEKGESCTNFIGRHTSIHDVRIRLCEKDKEVYEKTLGERNHGVSTGHSKINKLNKKLNALEQEVAKKEYEEEFIYKAVPASIKPNELTIEDNGLRLTIIKTRNLKGVYPGDRVPSFAVAEILMERGVDVIIVRTPSRFYS